MKLVQGHGVGGVHVEAVCLVNAGIKILAVAEFFSEKDMDGGKSPEFAGKAR
jgi:hypothetical protein